MAEIKEMGLLISFAKDPKCPKRQPVLDLEKYGKVKIVETPNSWDVYFRGIPIEEVKKI